MIHEYHFHDTHWFWASWAYRDEQTAEQAWERLRDVGARQAGKLELGFYRHGSEVSGMIVVTALGMRKHGVNVAEKILGAQAYDGFENSLPWQTLDALIARRVRVIDDLHKQSASKGSYELRRDRGVTMNPDGTMREN